MVYTCTTWIKIEIQCEGDISWQRKRTGRRDKRCMQGIGLCAWGPAKQRGGPQGQVPGGTSWEGLWQELKQLPASSRISSSSGKPQLLQPFKQLDQAHSDSQG